MSDDLSPTVTIQGVAWARSASGVWDRVDPCQGWTTLDQMFDRIAELEAREDELLRAIDELGAEVTRLESTVRYHEHNDGTPTTYR